MREEVIGDCRLILGDCRDILPTLSKVDAVVTDPPYGIGADAHAGPAASGWTQWTVSGWDSARPAANIFAAILACSKHQIIWGGNYFTDYLPPSMQWIVWDKGQRDFSLADFEMAWSSQNKAARIFDFARGKALLDGKQHPTQKPVELMKFCLELLPTKFKSILDPFMGSGTTGVACVKLGKSFIGIEREPSYFDIACRRIEQAYKQPDLFIEKPKPAHQEAML